VKTKLITAPLLLPVSLIEAKSFYRVIGNDDDADIMSTLGLATEKAEQLTNRQILPATWGAYLDAFQSKVILPKPPFTTITKVEYKNISGVLTLWTDFYVDNIQEPAVLYFNSFPSDVKSDGVNNVVITYTCGYAVVPDSIKYFILNYGLTRFENREFETLNASVDSSIYANLKHLLDDYRIIPV